ncbi:DUF4397 domain-containing protein [Hymenobacter latericus]|uniref:DUF4397 domain-containing protein n=1 Tax=Hymenobacter sp. YIM 151858-1 TaxID=2987688 RepID=UPI0022262E7F|nr:DUF4397 domain-containing protein [Hymenobacter sp. YIM 151858-1]UYZ57627.1 DUF4397 domain-containing protein [Hymenobacter sp. YIM 151858-1]
MNTRLLYLAALSAAALLGQACSADKSEAPAPKPAPQGQVRIVNNLTASQPITGEIQLYVGGKAVGPGAATGKATPYQPVAAGEHFVQIMLPTASGSGTQWVQFSALPIAESKRYSLFTRSTGSLHHTALVVEEAALPAPVAGKAHIRVVNTASQATPVRIEDQQSNTALYSEVGWGAVTAYQAVDARTYRLNVMRATSPQTPLFVQGAALEPGKAYSLVLRGSTEASAVPTEQLAFDVIEDQ